MLNSRKNNGVSLIEIMLALSISIGVFFLLLEIYTSSQRSLAIERTLSDLQYSATTAISILDAAITKAGHIGCGRLNASFPIFSSSSDTLSAKNKINGDAAEVLSVRFMEISANSLASDMLDQQNLILNSTDKFKVNDVLVISDCRSADIFHVASIDAHADGQTLTSVAPLQQRYQSNAEVGRFNQLKFYIAKTTRTDRRHTPIFSLYMEDTQHRRNELVSGVNAISYKYTQALAQGWQTVTADQVNDWSQVVGIAIELTVGSGSLQKNWYHYVKVGS